MLPSDPPYHKFNEFIDPSADRFKVLFALLTELDLHFSVVNFAESRHFFISSSTKERPASVLVAHYDAAEGSPGANDNASSVFILISVAMELYGAECKNKKPWMVILTDNEELGGTGIRSQGSYLLGRGLKNTDLAGAAFYVFDSCGRGDTLIISTITDYILKNETGGSIAVVRKRRDDLRNNAFSAAQRSQMNNFMLLPAPFSDDAGFLYAGLASQMLTMLPRDEAASFASLSRSRPEYVNALVSSKIRAGIDPSKLPETWNILNTPDDTAEKLTPENIPSLIKLARTILIS